MDRQLYIHRLKKKEKTISSDGISGFLEMFRMMHDPYHLMRRAAESLEAGRLNDNALAASGRAEIIPHVLFWNNRAAAFRQRAVQVLKERVS